MAKKETYVIKNLQLKQKVYQRMGHRPEGLDKLVARDDGVYVEERGSLQPDVLIHQVCRPAVAGSQGLFKQLGLGSMNTKFEPTAGENNYVLSFGAPSAVDRINDVDFSPTVVLNNASLDVVSQDTAPFGASFIATGTNPATAGAYTGATGTGVDVENAALNASGLKFIEGSHVELTLGGFKGKVPLTFIVRIASTYQLGVVNGLDITAELDKTTVYNSFLDETDPGSETYKDIVFSGYTDANGRAKIIFDGVVGGDCTVAGMEIIELGEAVGGQASAANTFTYTAPTDGALTDQTSDYGTADPDEDITLATVGTTTTVTVDNLAVGQVEGFKATLTIPAGEVVTITSETVKVKELVGDDTAQVVEFELDCLAGVTSLTFEINGVFTIDELVHVRKLYSGVDPIIVDNTALYGTDAPAGVTTTRMGLHLVRAVATGATVSGADVTVAAGDIVRAGTISSALGVDAAGASVKFGIYKVEADGSYTLFAQSPRIIVDADGNASYAFGKELDSIVAGRDNGNDLGVVLPEGVYAAAIFVEDGTNLLMDPSGASILLDTFDGVIPTGATTTAGVVPVQFGTYQY